MLPCVVQILPYKRSRVVSKPGRLVDFLPLFFRNQGRLVLLSGNHSYSQGVEISASDRNNVQLGGNLDALINLRIPRARDHCTQFHQNPCDPILRSTSDRCGRLINLVGVLVTYQPSSLFTLFTFLMLLVPSIVSLPLFGTASLFQPPLTGHFLCSIPLSPN